MQKEEPPVEIEWFRDLFICIFGLVATVVSIFIAVLLFKIYRRVKVILDSMKTTAKTIQSVSGYAGSEVIKPLMQIAAVVQGVRQGIEAISKLFKKKEED